MGEVTLKPLEGKNHKESLHIVSGEKGRSVSATLLSYEFKDKATGCFVLYVPSLETSGYGDTPDEAITMVKSSLNDFFDHLFSLGHKDKIEHELNKYGW